MFLDQNSKVISIEFSLCQIRYRLVKTFQDGMLRDFYFKLIEVETQVVFHVLKADNSLIKILCFQGLCTGKSSVTVYLACEISAGHQSLPYFLGSGIKLSQTEAGHFNIVAVLIILFLSVLL